MLVNLVAIGSKMPVWVQQGYQDYAKRLTADIQLKLIEVPAIKRGKKPPISQILEQEANLILQAIPAGNISVLFDRTGRAQSTCDLATHINTWKMQGATPCFVIGGPEGVAPSLRANSSHCWSLSDLTLPHPLVRVILAEQIYRAWSILNHHPYHR